MSTFATSKPPKTRVKRYLVCYSGLASQQSRRWHRFLRSCGTRILAGVYELEMMTPRLSTRLYREALEAVSAGGRVNLYPICGACESRGWSVGDGEQQKRDRHDATHFIV